MIVPHQSPHILLARNEPTAPLKKLPMYRSALILMCLVQPLPPLIGFTFEMEWCQRNLLCFRVALILKELINAIEPLSRVIAGVPWKLKLSHFLWKNLPAYIHVISILCPCGARMIVLVIMVMTGPGSGRKQSLGQAIDHHFELVEFVSKTKLHLVHAFLKVANPYF